jgi:hypothetical protein
VHAIRHRADLPGLYDELDDPPLGKPTLSLEESDSKLNRAWQHLVSDLKSAQKSGQLDSLRKEQHAWLAFRDSFAAIRPDCLTQPPAFVWLASLEANRAEELMCIDSTTVAILNSR